jgi:hypothetical protein
MNNDADEKRTNTDLKLNIISASIPLLGIFAFWTAINNARSMGPDVVAFAIGVAGLTFLLGFVLAVFAMIRKEPRAPLTAILLFLYGIGSLLLFAGFFQMVEF